VGIWSASPGFRSYDDYLRLKRNDHWYIDIERKKILEIEKAHMNCCNISMRHSVPFQRGFIFHGIFVCCDCNHTQEQWEDGPPAKLRKALTSKDFSTCTDIVHCGMIHSDDIEIKFADGRIAHSE